MTNTITFQTIEKQLKIESSVFPSVVTAPNDVLSLADATEWIKQSKTELETELEQSGAILFRGFPLNDAQTFDAFSSAFDYPSFTYQESLSNAVRINFTERVFTANEAPKDVEIFLHQYCRIF